MITHPSSPSTLQKAETKATHLTALTVHKPAEIKTQLEDCSSAIFLEAVRMKPAKGLKYMFV